MIDNFLTRHLGPREKEIQQMLSFIGVESIEELLTETIPEEIRLKDKLESNTPLSEKIELPDQLRICCIFSK